MASSNRMTHVQCRALGHAWHPSSIERKARYGVFTVVMQCSRCLTLRIDGLTAKGVLNTRAYSYPEDYKSSKKIKKTRWREQLIKEMTNGA